mmetsp:Transcript_122940/g.183924  ORF Transcript_122940/g.183924 Transcript_122940/m.183924 type:complete len:167 (+) Transcript_122940:26-526(+)
MDGSQPGKLLRIVHPAVSKVHGQSILHHGYDPELHVWDCKRLHPFYGLSLGHRQDEWLEHAEPGPNADTPGDDARKPQVDPQHSARPNVLHDLARFDLGHGVWRKDDRPERVEEDVLRNDEDLQRCQPMGDEGSNILVGGPEDSQRAQRDEATVIHEGRHHLSSET